MIFVTVLVNGEHDQEYTMGNIFKHVNYINTADIMQRKSYERLYEAEKRLCYVYSRIPDEKGVLVFLGLQKYFNARLTNILFIRLANASIDKLS